MASGRRGFLRLVLGAAAALVTGRLFRAAVSQGPVEKRTGAAPVTPGWREARHWRKI